MTEFDLWLRGCELNGTLPWCLHGTGDTAVYMTKTRYEVHFREFFHDPVYHVWIGGHCEATTLCYQTALAVYRNRGGVA